MRSQVEMQRRCHEQLTQCLPWMSVPRASTSFSEEQKNCKSQLFLTMDCQSIVIRLSPSTCSLIACKSWCLSLELSLLMSNVYGMGRAVTNDMRLFSHCKSTKASMHVIMFVYSSSLNHFRGRYLR